MYETISERLEKLAQVDQEKSATQSLSLAEPTNKSQLRSLFNLESSQDLRSQRKLDKSPVKNGLGKVDQAKIDSKIDATKLILVVIEEFHQHRKRVRNHLTKSFLAHFKTEKPLLNFTEIKKAISQVIAGKKKSQEKVDDLGDTSPLKTNQSLKKSKPNFIA